VTGRIRATLAVSMLAAWACVAAGAGDRAPRSEYACYRAAGPIVIDGKLDEKAWKDTVPTPVFGDIVTGEAPRYAVRAKLLWDDRRVYLAYEVEDPNVWAHKTMRGDPMAADGPPGYLTRIEGAPVEPDWGGYRESFVKLYVDPDGDGANYTEMHVSPLDKVCDKWQERSWSEDTRERMGLAGDPNPHPEWDCPGLRTAVSIQGTLNDPYDVDRGWTVEMAIPFASLKQFAGESACPPRPGDTWRMHLGRRYRASPEAERTDVTYWTWPMTGVLDCHEPDEWGYVTFRERHERRPWADLPKVDFDFKALWAHPQTSVQAVREMVKLADRMGFNVLIVQVTGSGQRCWYESKMLNKPANVQIDPLQETIKQAKTKGLSVYAWMVNLAHGGSQALRTEHPEYYQVVKPHEQARIGTPRVNPDRVNVHGGEWLCPDRGLIDYDREIIEEIVTNYDIDGLALDYVGYRNYYACFCEYSNQKRKEYALSHPGLTEKQVLEQYSEESLVAYVADVAALAKGIDPRLALGIHIYPDFDPNPLYGNRLPVDYCGQTVAWFYKPFWSYGKVFDKARQYKQAEGKYHEGNTFVPFVGVASGERLKPADRVRTEIRIAGASGARSVMLAFYRTFLDHPELAHVVAEELR